MPQDGVLTVLKQTLGKVLKSSGCSGPITIEPFVFQSPDYPPFISVWHSLADPNDLVGAVETAKKGVSYLQSIIS